MGEKQNQSFQLVFNASLKVDFQGSRVTSNGGLILVRELDERLGLEKIIGEHLSDSRQGCGTPPSPVRLVRSLTVPHLWPARAPGIPDLHLSIGWAAT